jgi:hypothetical protein
MLQQCNMSAGPFDGLSIGHKTDPDDEQSRDVHSQGRALVRDHR